MNTLKDRVAIVTGAGRGIGEAVAKALADEGASVVVNDLGVTLNGEIEGDHPAAQVVRSIEADGGAAVASDHDVADHDAARALIDLALEVFGRLDIVVNVAGILRDRLIFNMSEDEWDAVIRVHLKGSFNTIRHASAHWRSQPDRSEPRRVINFTSGAGLHGAPQANYSAAKLGVVGLTYACANSLARYGATANAIAPKAATRMTETMKDQTAMQGEPDEFAPANVTPIVTYLASDAAQWCTGQVIMAGGHEVIVYRNPEPLVRLVAPGPWPLDQLSSAMETTVRPLVDGKDYDPFGWVAGRFPAAS